MTDFRDRSANFPNGLLEYGLAPRPPFKVNRNHPLADSLSGYFPLFAGIRENICNGQQFITPNAGSAGDWTWKQTDRGPGLWQNGTVQGGFNNSGPNIIIGAGALRYTIFAIVNSNGGGIGTSAGDHIYGEQTSGTIVGLNSTTTFIRAINSSTASGTNIDVTLTADEATHSYCYTKDISGGAGMVLYRDGISVGTGAWKKADTYNTATNYLGGTAGGGKAWPGAIVMVAVWNRVLTVPEIMEMHWRPFSLLIPADTRTSLINPGAVAQSITPPLFSDTPDTFYAPTILRSTKTLTPGLISDTPDTFYAPRMGRGLKPGLISDTPDTFYAPTILRGVKTLTPGLVTDPDTITPTYAPTILKGVRTLSPGLVSDTPDTFYAPTVVRSKTLTPGLVSDTPDTFYAPTVIKGVRTLTPGLVSDTPDTFYAPTIQRGARTITVALYSDTPDTFYAPTVVKGARTLTPGLVSDTPDTFYAPSVGRSVRPALYSDTPDTFYAPEIITGGGEQTLTVPLHSDTPDTVYAPTILRGARTLTAALYSDTPDTFYAPTVLRGARTLTTALYSDTPDTFYAPSVTRGVRTLTPALYSDTPDTFYAPTIIVEQFVSPALYSDTPDTFYAPTVAGAAATISPALYTDADVFYTPQVYRMEFLYPDADLTDGGWTNELDSNVNLFDSINELSANDNDYIKSSSEPVNDITKIGIGNPVPIGQTQIQPFKVKYRYKKLTNLVGTMELKVRLMQGASLIAEWTHSDISGTFVDGVQELTLGQFNSITDFDDLNVEFEADWAA